MMSWRRRREDQPPPPRCPTPGCDRPAITGDGPDSPCWACLFRFGDAAARPDSLSDGEIALLLEAHGDVVELVQVARVQRWGWRRPSADVT